VYQPGDLKVVHRLDANTTGLMLLARSRAAATNLGKQFESNKVLKRYLVRCCAHPKSDSFTCDDPIARKRTSGGTRGIELGGHAATTEFRVIRRLGDGSSLLEARPLTGRTNQIRIHLWGMGMPVVGDPAYLQEGRLAARQTLPVDQPPMCLHAARLSLTHPATGEPFELVAPQPAWLEQLAFQ
jgi:RluA family pseudouridine synthase